MSQDDIDYIKNVLDRGTVTWAGRAECLRRSRKSVFERKSKKGNDIFKFYYQCNHCKKWFRDAKSLEVDHIEEVGSFKGDWNDYILRRYSPQENLQALCISCHLKKTTKYNSALTRYKRK